MELSDAAALLLPETQAAALPPSAALLVPVLQFDPSTRVVEPFVVRTADEQEGPAPIIWPGGSTVAPRDAGQANAMLRSTAHLIPLPVVCCQVGAGWVGSLISQSTLDDWSALLFLSLGSSKQVQTRVCEIFVCGRNLVEDCSAASP